MATAAKKKLVVCGGNGFLGSRIVKSAVSRGWKVTSIARSGEPTWSSVTSSSTEPAWSKDVTWHAANILHPSEYAHLLDDTDAVVHSMGILLEADYKGVLTGKESVFSGLSRAFSATKQGSSDPLATKGDVEPLEKDGQITYELMNRDSAILLAKQAAAKNVKSFVYISATDGTKLLPARYLTTKRAAESTIAAEFPGMRNIFVRPSFLYDSSRGFTIPLAGLTFAASMVNSAVGGRLQWLMGAGGVKPLQADVVAEAVVEGLQDQDVSGVVDVPDIERLANRQWRRDML